ncbi:MAG: response regulator [Hyphomicrobiales bacterium]
MASEHFKPQDLFSQLEELERAVETETAARSRAEAESRAKSELLATVSHEVRTPLGAIISMADLLLATPLNETQRKYVETLEHSGRGLLTVVNGILDYSKLEAGQFELAAAPFDLHELLRSVAESLKARAAGRGLSAHVEIAAGCPVNVVGDAARIRQVLDNLVDNAIKFTEQGTVTLRAGHEIQGGVLVLRFEIIDTGMGLTQQQQARLFKPYAQGDRSVAPRYGGTGLGLHIARRLAKMMGGEIGCDSERGAGSTFWFTVRAGAGDAPRRAAPREAPAPAAEGALRGRVLVVEDNHINQMLIAAYLDRFGLAYDMAANGVIALQRIAAVDYDLALMDVMMPEMDGLECTRRIRALSGPKARLPIVALTANAMKGDRESYLAAGMDGYVSKPVSAKDLHDAIAALLPSATDRRSATA